MLSSVHRFIGSSVRRLISARVRERHFIRFLALLLLLLLLPRCRTANAMTLHFPATACCSYLYYSYYHYYYHDSCPPHPWLRRAAAATTRSDRISCCRPSTLSGTSCRSWRSPSSSPRSIPKLASHSLPLAYAILHATNPPLARALARRSQREIAIAIRAVCARDRRARAWRVRSRVRGSRYSAVDPRGGHAAERRGIEPCIERDRVSRRDDDDA